MLYNAYQGSCGPGSKKCVVKGPSKKLKNTGKLTMTGGGIKLKKKRKSTTKMEDGSHVNPNRMQGARKTTVPSSGIGDKKQYDKFSSEKYKTRKDGKRVTVKLPTQG